MANVTSELFLALVLKYSTAKGKTIAKKLYAFNVFVTTELLQSFTFFLSVEGFVKKGFELKVKFGSLDFHSK